MPQSHLALAAVAVLAFCSQPTHAAEPAPNPPPTFPVDTRSLAERMPLFAYERSADFGLEEKGVETRGNASVRDISLIAVPGQTPQRIAGYIVSPTKNATTSCAGIFWVHWLGEPATSNRTQFLDEAVELAGRGVISVMVDAMWSNPKWYGSRVLEEDYTNSVRQVIALRRGLDLLTAQTGVDQSRLAFVGHDYGAMYGVIALALEQRVRACIFIAATPSLNDWAFFAKKPASMDDYLRQNAVLELKDYVRELKDTAVFMQFAEKDHYVPLNKAEEFFLAAPNPKHMTVYGGTGHEMTKPESIRKDRDAWLAEVLRLP